jgi:hypothetical protein
MAKSSDTTKFKLSFANALFIENRLNRCREDNFRLLATQPRKRWPFAMNMTYGGGKQNLKLQVRQNVLFHFKTRDYETASSGFCAAAASPKCRMKLYCTFSSGCCIARCNLRSPLLCGASMRFSHFTANQWLALSIFHLPLHLPSFSRTGGDDEAAPSVEKLVMVGSTTSALDLGRQGHLSGAVELGRPQAPPRRGESGADKIWHSLRTRRSAWWRRTSWWGSHSPTGAARPRYGGGGGPRTISSPPWLRTRWCYVAGGPRRRRGCRSNRRWQSAVLQRP